MKIHSFPVVAMSRTTLLTTSLGMAFVSHGAVTPITWSGASGTDATAWADGTNWVGGTAPADDLVTASAVFDLADFTGKQPNAGTRSVAGVQIGSGTATGALTLSGTQLTVGASGINVQANAAAATISSSVVLGAAQTWSNSSTNALTVGGIVSGSGFNLTKGGSGTLVLTGANSYTGSTSVSGGTLQLGNGTIQPTINSTYDIASGATLRIQYNTTGSAAQTWSKYTGAGTLALTSGKNFDFGWGQASLGGTFTGTLQIERGRVHTLAPGNLGGASTVVVKNGGQLGVWEGGTFTQNLTITGAGYGEAGYEAAIRMSNEGKTTLLNGTLTLDGDATIGARSSGANIGTATIVNPIGQTTTSNLTVGAGSLSGTVVFNAANTYTGTTTVRNGVLSLNAAAPTVLGNLQMIGGDGTYARMQQPNQFAAGVVANFTSASTAWNRFELFGKNQTLAGANTGTATTQGGGIFQDSEVNGAAGANATLTFNGSGSYVFNGHVRDYGSPNAGTNKLSLVKEGTGTQMLAGSVVTYSGTTSINSGTLELRNTNAFQSPTTIASGATLRLTNNGDTGAGNTNFTIALNSGATLTHDGQAANHYWTLPGAVTNTGTTTINQSSIAAGLTNKSLFLDGGLKGTGTVTINATNAGNGVVFRNNNTTFSGNLIVNGIADADVNEGSGIGVGGCTTGLQNTDIQLNGTMELLAQGIGWAGSAAGAFQTGALSGNGVMVGNHTASGITTVTVGNTNISATFSGVIANGANNTVHLVKAGTGTQTLTGTNTYTGNTTVNGGTLAISGGSSLSDTGTLTLADVAGVQLTLSSNETTGALAGGGATGGNVNLQGNTLTLAGTANTTYSGVLSGTGSALTKTGTGTQTLAGVNTYSGATTINAGTLNLTGSLPNSAVTVADGAIIGGEGTMPSMTLGSASGADIIAVPATSGALTATGALSVSGTTFVQLTGPVTTPAFKVVSFGSNANGFTNSNFELDNAISYRPGYAFTVNANDVTLTMAKKTIEWTGAVDNFWDNGIAANFRDTTTLAAESFFNADDVVFGNVPATDQTVEVDGDLNPSSVTFNSTLNYTITGDTITGPGSMTKNGSGTATLANPNTYTGLTQINAGTLAFKAPADADWILPTGAKTVASGAAMKVDFTPQSPTQFRHTHLGATAINAGGVLDLYSTTYNLASWHLIQTWTGGATGTGTIRVSGGGAVGCWTGAVNPLSAFAGTLDIQNGQFAVNVDSATTLGGTLDVNVAAAGKLDMRTGNFIVDSLDGAVGGQILKSWNTGVTLTVGNNNGSGNFAGTISNANGTIALTKTGTGTQTLSGANTNTGATTVNGGTLALSGGSAIADTAAVSLANSAGVSLLLNASETIGSLAGGGTTGGNVNLQGNTLTVANATSTNFAGVISGAGGLVKEGVGTLTLSGANSYSGNTTVNAGVLSLASAFLADSSTVTIATGAVLNLTTGTSDTVGSLVLGGTTVPSGTYNSSHPTYGSFFTGTGSLVVGGNAYDSWTASKGLAGADALQGADPDKDGIVNALEFVLGGEPNPANPGSNSTALLPKASLTSTDLVFTFRRNDTANTMPGMVIATQYGSTLTGWTTAQHGTDGVTITVTDDGFGTGVDKVDVSIPKSLATGSKLFARLTATLP